MEPPEDGWYEDDGFENTEPPYEDSPPDGPAYEECGEAFAAPVAKPVNGSALPKQAHLRAGPVRVDDVIGGLIATLHGADSTLVQTTMGRILAAKAVWEHMNPEQYKLWQGVLEVLDFEVKSLEGPAPVDFKYLPAIDSRRPQVKKKLDELRQRSIDGDLPRNPASEFDQLIEDIAGDAFIALSEELAGLIVNGGNAAEKMKIFRKIPAPTFQRSERNKNWSKTAREWDEDSRSNAGSNATDMILSFGMPTLEIAVSVAGEAQGVMIPGEFWVFGAGTGHGKSSFGRRAAPATAWDLVNGWKVRNGKVIYLHTEEESIDVAKAMMLCRGQSFHDLSDHMIIAKIGQSRSRIVEVFYDTIADAIAYSLRTGSPLRESMPYVMFVDYVQGIHEPGENADTDGVKNTADLLMRGIAACDPEMIAQISGIDFRTYTGLDWPDGLETHRIAVGAFAQLRKEANDHTVYYREGKSSIADFAVIDENGRPCWQPQENDYCIPKRSDIRGSGVLLQHATGLIFLHRRQPEASQIKDESGKVIALSSEVGEFIVPKARKGIGAPYIPMRFGPNPEGFRAQWYDDLAEKNAIGRIEFADCYERPGDPLIPVRARRSPFSGTRY
jgi:hypothetical protein